MKEVDEIKVEYKIANQLLLRPPEQVEQIIKVVGMDAYLKAKAKRETPVYWDNHYNAGMKWCYERFYNGRTDLWPGLGNEWFCLVADKMREVTEKKTRIPIIPIVKGDSNYEKSREIEIYPKWRGKRTIVDASKMIKAGRGFAIYYADNEGPLADGDEILFNTTNGKSSSKTVVVENNPQFGTNLRDDVSLRLLVEDLNTLYNGRLYVKRKVSDREELVLAPIEKDTEAHVRCENGWPLFFADYKIDQVVRSSRQRDVEADRKQADSEEKEDANSIMKSMLKDELKLSGRNDDKESI